MTVVDALLSALVDLFDGDTTLMAVCAGMLCLSALGAIVVSINAARAKVSRRIAADTDTSGSEQAAERPGRVSALVTRFADKVHEPSAADRKELRHRLIQAGFVERSAAHWFIATRVVCMPIFAAIGFALVSWLKPDTEPSYFAAYVMGAAILGYLAPAKLLDRRLKQRRAQNRDGFPDFMDLMVVCCQAGLSMEAGMNRVAGEIQVAYPSLASNLQIATMELRGGLALARAIDGLAKRLGIEEAQSFATLLQQSEELGSSLTQSLRAYSEDMRNKRLMRAEEKANALPAKLVIPLTLFVFPVIMVVIMLPVVIGVTAS